MRLDKLAFPLLLVLLLAGAMQVRAEDVSTSWIPIQDLENNTLMKDAWKVQMPAHSLTFGQNFPDGMVVVFLSDAARRDAYIVQVDTGAGAARLSLGRNGGEPAGVVRTNDLTT